MILVIGEVLLDRFADYTRIGGAPFNFAFHLKQLAVPVRLITRVGADNDGDTIRAVLRQNGFPETDIQVDPDHRTGTVNVSLNAAGVPAFEILTDVAYDYLQLAELPRSPHWDDVRLIYFGSLLQRTPRGAAQFTGLLAQRGPRTQCLCDINLRPPHYSSRTIQNCLNQADFLKLNAEELIEIGEHIGGPGDPDALALEILDRYRIALLAITRGAAGSTLLTGQTRIDLPAPPADIIDTVGAGDGYAAVLALGLLADWSLENIAAAAGTFAARICALPGAVPEDPRVYDDVRQYIGGSL